MNVIKIREGSAEAISAPPFVLLTGPGSCPSSQPGVYMMYTHPQPQLAEGMPLSPPVEFSISSFPK